ncbi:uncharacterized protein LOC117402795 isoform X1 [Acipenser ruthenus]|uniref:uncharacterized protein LOC117402795 isoform X1 n=1 Tax=Acipenser ruthenus TaxID=7906 RepID=UPI00145B5ED9|nr:uncharacterized protein LOC117402795 isoform X1 [Acipenser ruthenus]XP_033860146.3 uncharacterized protein LOC117402795 isoform X1 [Acipenser ruthenus]XP_058880168.1 uncharacterized protein LOC117402795 isoform X1 [Acipenser ruthenus]
MGVEQLCVFCAQLLKDFVALVRGVTSDFAQKIRDCVDAISQCSCLKRKKAAASKLYKPVLQQHERQAAQKFLQHLDTGTDKPLLDNDCLHALRTLAVSENPNLQQSAAIYYLHISQQLNAPLPVEFLEPYNALLQSSDMEVQRITSLSLVNLLVEENVNKELVVEMGMLEPILELLESGDPTVQCNSCACVATLTTSESNREAIASAGGVLPVLVLAKSYDPRVQQNAVGAVLNLTRSERTREVLWREGALPVLTILLESADSEVQYYSCSALSNFATNPEYHQMMLQVGDRFLLKALLSLMSSSVQKICCQSCRCLRNLSVNVNTQEALVAMGCIPQLKALLRSSSEPVSESAVTLLSALSEHPPNRGALVDEGFLKILKELLSYRTNPVILSHTTYTIRNLSSSQSVQAVIDSECVEGLLQTLACTDTTEESLLWVTTCVKELTALESLKSHIAEKLNSELVGRLIGLAGQLENTELSFHAAYIIGQLEPKDEVRQSLKPHISEVLGYLLRFLSHQEVRFQHLGILTLCRLNEDANFSSAIGLSPLVEQLQRFQQQTEETQALLRMAMHSMNRGGQGH